jgi:histidinol dehydrogenase
LPRGETAAASWRDFGAIIEVPDIDGEQAFDRQPDCRRTPGTGLRGCGEAVEKVRNAGAIFIGRYTPEVIGDYVGGSNHVLPTARSARFSSGLSVLDFVKRTSLLQLGPEQLRALGPAAIALAEAEGLDAHGKSVSIRLNL